LGIKAGDEISTLDGVPVKAGPANSLSAALRKPGVKIGLRRGGTSIEGQTPPAPNANGPAAKKTRYARAEARNCRRELSFALDLTARLPAVSRETDHEGTPANCDGHCVDSHPQGRAVLHRTAQPDRQPLPVRIDAKSPSADCDAILRVVPRLRRCDCRRRI